jgi:hypothetical protein
VCGHYPHSRSRQLPYNPGSMTTPAIPSSIPAEVTIAATVKCRLAFVDYKASDGWDLALYFRGAGPGLDIDGALVVADGDAWLVTIPATSTGDDPATANLSPGTYYWQAWVTKGAEEYEAAKGTVTVKQNLFDLDASAAYDGRSENEANLAAVRVALGKKVANDRQEYQIAGRMKREHSFADLMLWESRLVQMVNQDRLAERAKQGKPLLENVHARFV